MTEADTFRAAWVDLYGRDDVASQLSRMSLEAMAQGIPSLEGALADLRAPLQAELDLHVTGGTIHGHEAVARPFGQFVTRAANAVREIAKSIGQKERYGASLRILAPSSGSVRVILRAPDTGSDSGKIPGDTDGDSLDSLAVKRLAAVLGQANSAATDPDTSPLVATVRTLRGPARAAIAKVAQSVQREGWQLDGELRQRGRNPSPIHLSTRGAAALIDAVGNDTNEIEETVLSGVIDGQRRSLSAMWFQPDMARSFEAAVDDAELLDEVAALAVDPTTRVVAKFRVFISYAGGDSAHARRSYELRDISPANVDEPML